MENGGKKFGYIPCLNDRDDHILLLTSLLENELHGWV
jgi:ferrochelatase